MLIDIDRLILHKNIEIDIDHIWGYEVRMVNNEKYCGKLLVLTNSDISSLHYHKDKTETFIILAGRVELVLGDVVMEFVAGDKSTIYPGTNHRFKAITRRALILEVSTHHEDSDTYRIEEAKSCA